MGHPILVSHIYLKIGVNDILGFTISSVLFLLLQSTHLIRGRIPLGLPSQAIFARIQKGLGPLIVDRRLNPFFAVQLRDRNLASEAL